LAQEIVESGINNSFKILDLNSVRDRIDLWQEHLPNVQMHYAVKTNSDVKIVKAIYDKGQKFDCASSAEIQKVIDLGASPEDIIYANPIKGKKHIEFAKNHGVKIMTFDSREEVEKIHQIYPEAELILRIAVTNTDAPYPMGNKFGAPADLWNDILDTCQNLNMKVRGVSFHVGSGGCSFEAYKSCLIDTEKVFKMIRQRNMPELDIVDIGGGFSMSATNPVNNFTQVAPKVANYLDNVFPGKNNKQVSVLGEPGRQISQDTTSMITQIFHVKEQGENRHYYVNNGVYHGFGSQVYDREFFLGQPLLLEAELKKRIAQE